jgi:AbrB family looped-hinge helix DNA binding protein
MPTVVESKITSKGQVTVPEAIREQLCLHTGDRLEWRVEEGGTVRVRRIGESLDELQGLLGRPSRRMTIDQMHEAVRERMRSQRARR